MYIFSTYYIISIGNEFTLVVIVFDEYSIDT